MSYKGNRDRTDNKKAYDACPLWANIDKDKNGLINGYNPKYYEIKDCPKCGRKNNFVREKGEDHFMCRDNDECGYFNEADSFPSAAVERAP